MFYLQFLITLTVTYQTLFCTLPELLALQFLGQFEK